MLSAVVIVAVTALFVYVGGLPFLAFMALISGVATYELCHMLSLRGLFPFTWIAVALSLAFVVDAQFGHDTWRLAAVGAVLVSLASLIFRTGHLSRSPVDWAVSFVGPLYIGVPMAHFVLLRRLEIGQHWGGLDPGLWWVVLAILGTWASDTGAYLIGSAFGRRGFMTHISKHKTWEGVIGGTLLCLVVVVVVGTVTLGIGLVPALVLGALVGPVAIVGDLAESVLKRGAGVKDSGRLIPGHGGMLDRVDSLIFTVVLVYYFALLLYSIGYS